MIGLSSTFASLETKTAMSVLVPAWYWPYLVRHSLILVEEHTELADTDS